MESAIKERSPEKSIKMSAARELVGIWLSARSRSMKVAMGQPTRNKCYKSSRFPRRRRKKRKRVSGSGRLRRITGNRRVGGKKDRIESISHTNLEAMELRIDDDRPAEWRLLVGQAHGGQPMQCR